jgi:hypothetical protein
MVRAQAQSTSLSGQAERRGGSAERMQCGFQRLLKNDCKEQKQHQHQREMINSDGREGNV